MSDLNDKIAALKKSGKIDKIKLYSEIIQDCYFEKQEMVYQYFDEMLEVLQQFLNFDPNLNNEIKVQFASTLKYLFLRIRNASDIKAFDKYRPVFDELKVLVNDKVIIAEIYQVYGYVSWLKNEQDKALKYLNRSLEIINQTDSLEIPQRYTNIGYIYEYKGDYEKAEEYYNKGLEFAKLNNSDSALEFAYAALGRLNHCIGRYDLAIKYYESSLSFSDNTKETINQIVIKSNIAMNYYRTDNTLKALSLLIEIKKDWVKKLNPELYYSIVSNIGSCYSALNDFKEAKKCYLQILKYAQKNNIITSLMSAYHSVGHCNLKLKEYSSAIEMLESALKCAEEGNPKKSMYINLTMGEVYLQLNELDSALKILIEADRIASKCADYLTQQSIKDKIAQCYELSGDYKSAHATLLELLDIVKIADKERTKADQETQESKLVTSSKKTHYLYSGGMSFLSHETNETIGLPIIGMTKEIKDVIEKAFLASKSNVNVLILGESGTGKESIAKLIHHSSIRSDNPFVEVNSAVFTTSLAESSLFGHKKGSFTGAVESHKGFIEASHKGTLFFDEIGEMPMEIQSMLLRVLETKEITPLGDSSKKTVDFRLICATNMDVAELAENDKFRFDLYHRINTVEIYLPPLRERKSDIPLLVKYYLQYFANEMNVPVPEISQDALTKLYNYKYPGNIRELKNIVQRMLLFCKNNLIEAENIYISNGEKISGAELTNDNLDLEAIEKKFINLAMARSNNVITNAAKLLGISSFALSRRIKKYELEF